MKTSYQSPVYKIRRVPLDQIRSNAYNPNSVAPPEMKLLYQSIKEDGYTMPIVCYKLEDGTYEIVDGFHRCLIMKTYRDIMRSPGTVVPDGGSHAVSKRLVDYGHRHHASLPFVNIAVSLHDLAA